MIDGVAFCFTGISRIALNRVYAAILYPFHDSHMIRASILTVIGPVKEYDITRLGLVAAGSPKATFPEPLDTAGAGRKSGQDSGFQIAALV